MRLSTLISAVMLCIGFCLVPLHAWAQDNPDYSTTTEVKKDNTAHWAFRGFAEIGMGTLFGTVAGGTSLITGVLVNPQNLKPTLIASAILYPAGVASGAILGGYLTDSKSTYWEPFVGAYAGALVADITAYFLSDEYPTLSAVLVIVMPILSTLMVMECSHAREKPKASKEHTIEPATAAMPLSFGFNF